MNVMGSIFRSLLVSALMLTGWQAQADDKVKVVYHLSEGTAQAARSINNISNHLAADPNAKIVVVAHGAGIDFLLQGAMTPANQPFSGSVGALAARGVEFRVCNNTLVTRKIDPSTIAMEATVVPSGVSEVAMLQAKQGYVYLRP